MKQEIGNQMTCLKEEMRKRVCEAWYSVAPNVLEVRTSDSLNEGLPIK